MAGMRVIDEEVRARCCVPFCGRSAKRPSRIGAGGVTEYSMGWEWICGKHWSPLPVALRRTHAANKRRAEASTSTVEDHVACDELWDRLKTKAIEIGMGIGT